MRQYMASKAFRFLALLVIASVAICPMATAQSYDPDQDIPHPTKFQKRLEKMGRGLSNILFGWAEIPLAWDRGVQQQRPLTQILTHGTIVGTTKFFMRFGIGIYEFFGFWDNHDEVGYGPLVEPEYLF